MGEDTPEIRAQVPGDHPDRPLLDAGGHGQRRLLPVLGRGLDDHRRRHGGRRRPLHLSRGPTPPKRRSRLPPSAPPEPEEGEDDLAARGQVVRRQVDEVHAEPGVPRVARRAQSLQPSALQWTTAGASASMRSVLPAASTALVVEAPHASGAETTLLDEVALARSAAACRRRGPSASERSSLRYSACAQTSGMAEPDGRPKKSSRSGMSGASQTCSGAARRRWRTPPWPPAGARASLRSPGGQLVMGALAGQQRPGPADAGAVERAGRPRARRSRRRCSGARTARRGVSTLSSASMTLTVLRMRGSSAARRPKRTSASASGLTMSEAGPLL